MNSFRTSGGLPLLDYSYNNSPVVSDQGLTPTQPLLKMPDHLIQDSTGQSEEGEFLTGTGVS